MLEKQKYYFSLKSYDKKIQNGVITWKYQGEMSQES